MRGTLLELTVRVGGDEAAIVAELLAGYELTGNFKGHEAEVIADFTAAEEGEAA